MKKKGFVMCKVPMRVAKVLMVLATTFIALSVFSAENATGTDSVMQKGLEFFKEWLIPDIRGNAIWALLVKLATTVVFLGLIFFSYFSQWIHVRWFLKGKPRGIFRLSGAETFGWRVGSSERKKYRMFESPKRQKVIDAINDHCGVFLVMGQAGVGKQSLIIRAKLKAKYVLVVGRDEWCDRHSEDQPVKKILKERTALLVNKLLWRRSVCILLTWNSVGTLEVPVPSPEQMRRIIKDLACTLREKKYGKVSFVVIVPAYYQISGISKEDLGNCRPPEAYSVSLLDCAECRSLLEAELQYRGGEGEVDVRACRHSLDEEAKRMGIALDRMIWIKSFGMPKYVQEIVSQQQYASVEAWISMRDWWNQVYNEKGQDKWLIFLYVLALKSLMNNGPVNAEELIVKLKDKLFCNNGDRLEKAEEALRLMCTNRRHGMDGNGRINAHPSPGKRQGKSFDLRKIDAELVFEDPYVIECFVGTLGYMGINPNAGTNDEEAVEADNGESVLDMNTGTNDEEAGLADKGEKVFDFKDDVYTAIDSAFGLGDCAECERLAAALWGTTERFSDLAQRLRKQYELLEEIKAVFVKDASKQSKIQEMYERRLKDPVIFQIFVRNVISRVGALPANTLGLIFEKINKILHDNNTLAGYVRLTFEMMPAYVISRRLPFAWGLDFQVFIDEMNRSDGEEDVQFKCASLICVAYAFYRHELTYDNLLFQNPAIKDHFDALDAAYLNISERVCKDNGSWQALRQILPVIRSMGKTYPLPRIDIGSLPSEVRTVWLSVLCKLAQYHGRNTRSEESKSIVRDMVSALEKIEFVGNDHTLFAYCMSMVSYCDGTSTNEGADALEHNIQYHTHKLEQWSDCPEMATLHFFSLCTVYLDCCDNGKVELLNSDMLWKLLGILRDWQQGMADERFSMALSGFAHLLSAFSADKVMDDVDVLFVWRDFAEVVKGFWKPILSGEKALEDWTMPYDYFSLFSYLSNVNSVSEDERVAVLTEIAPTECMFSGDLCYTDTARYICKCNKELIPPHLRIFWAAQCIAGRTRELLSDDSTEMILAAQELIQEARDNGRKVDEELVRLLYEANGLQVDQNLATGKKDL